MKIRIRPLSVDGTEARAWAWDIVKDTIPWLAVRVFVWALVAAAFLFVCSLFVLAPPNHPLNCWRIRQQNGAVRRVCADHFQSVADPVLAGYQIVTLYDHEDRVTGVYTWVLNVEPDK